MDAWRGFAETGGPGFLNVVEQLITRDFASGEMVPLLATAWELVDDRTIQFTLREGVSFHDGSAFNAEAAAASINHTFRPRERLRSTQLHRLDERRGGGRLHAQRLDGGAGPDSAEQDVFRADLLGAAAYG